MNVFPPLLISWRITVCHSVEQKMVKYISERLAVKVMTMAKGARLTDVVVSRTGPDILCCIHYMARLVMVLQCHGSLHFSKYTIY